MAPEPVDATTLTNRLLAKLYVGQQRHRHSAIVDLIGLGMAHAKGAVVLDLSEDQVQAVLDEAAELASRSIGRPPAAGGPPN